MGIDFSMYILLYNVKVADEVDYLKKYFDIIFSE